MVARSSSNSSASNGTGRPCHRHSCRDAGRHARAARSRPRRAPAARRPAPTAPRASRSCQAASRLGVQPGGAGGAALPSATRRIAAGRRLRQPAAASRGYAATASAERVEQRRGQPAVGGDRGRGNRPPAPAPCAAPSRRGLARRRRAPSAAIGAADAPATTSRYSAGRGRPFSSSSRAARCARARPGWRNRGTAAAPPSAASRPCPRRRTPPRYASRSDRRPARRRSSAGGLGLLGRNGHRLRDTACSAPSRSPCAGVDAAVVQAERHVLPELEPLRAPRR